MTEVPPRQPASPRNELRRSSEGRFLMGVCAGLGRHTGIDPVVFRMAFVVLLLGSGMGIFLYLAAFLLMKEPHGGPGIIEQWTRRDFDAEAVLALLTGVLGFGLAINMATVWFDTGTLVVGVLLAVSLLAAHASGVDLVGLARSMPERLSRRRTQERVVPSHTGGPPAPPVNPAPAPAAAAEPAVDRTAAYASETAPVAGAEVGQAAPAAEPAAPAGETLAYGTGAAPDLDRDHAQDHAQEQDQEQGQDRPKADRAEAERAADDRFAQGPERGPAATARGPVPPYRPAAPRPEPAASFRSHGVPYAPNGPYRPLDPAKREGGYSPYDPALYGRPIPRPQRRPRPRSFIGVITILLSIIVGGIIVAVQARSAAGVSPTIVGGAMLITIGAGLLVAAWWGRGAGLVAAGTTVALIVSVGLMLGGLPRNIGPSEWSPTTLGELDGVYDVGVGDGRLDLSDLKLSPGTTVTVDARVSLGELEVIVPPTVRLEVHASNKVGDITVDQSVRSGVDVKLDRVLEPETKPDGEVSTIVLNLRGGLGDMEVRRAA